MSIYPKLSPVFYSCLWPRRQATKDAGEIAGLCLDSTSFVAHLDCGAAPHSLRPPPAISGVSIEHLRNVLRIVNEPTAAAIAYGLDAKSKDKKKGADSWLQAICIFRIETHAPFARDFLQSQEAQELRSLM